MQHEWELVAEVDVMLDAFSTWPISLATTLQYWTGPEGSRRLRLAEVLHNRRTTGEGVLALRTEPPLPPQDIPGTKLC